MYALGEANLIKEISSASIQMILDLFFADLCIVRVYKSTVAWYDLSGLCSYKLTAIWAPVKTYVFFWRRMV